MITQNERVLQEIMKNDLVCLSQLAELWGKKYQATKRMLLRGRFTTAIYLQKAQAQRIGLAWRGNGRQNPNGRPYISISDPTIPDHVRKKYYEKFTHEPSGLKSLTGARQPLSARAEGREFSLQPSPQEPVPGKDLKSNPAVGKGTNFLPPQRTRKHQLSDSFAYKENDWLRSGASLKTPREEGTSSPGTELLLYRQLPDYARRQIDKYLPLIKETVGMTSAETKKTILEWNKENPKLATTSRSLRHAKKKYRERGIEGLVSRHGHRAGTTIVKAEWLEYFKSLYLKEGAPSAKSCWTIARGRFRSEKTFPVPTTFVYQLRRRMPEESIYFARHGEGAWNRKYGMYIERDYSNIRCGEVWVSDHAQVDVAVSGADGKVHFPWVTAWRDYKSGKWLGWLIHFESPNSDHIFQSFYYACRDSGIPKHIYIDNGKDYRSKDFAGGRKKAVKISIDEQSTRSICGMLDISVHFSLPYNAQAKTIECDFLKVKEHFSKHLPGYRGGHVKERPEILQKEIRRGKIFEFEELCKLFNAHIVYNLNRASSKGRNLNGLCPDELYEREARNELVSEDALSILCMRVSGEFAIGRNGVRDSRNKVTYFAEWMLGAKGKKVYLRRDPGNMEVAWVFDAAGDEYLGKGYMLEPVPALATEVEREFLSKRMADKKTARKVAKAYASDVREISGLEKVANMAVGNAMLSGYTPAPNTNSQKSESAYIGKAKSILKKDRQLSRFGKADLSRIAPPPRPEKKKIYLFATDKEDDELNPKQEEERNADS